ncbi:hypothetical protein [Microbacterium sp. Clip185]|uniref:hypothetical protein n=1 Tax=Microbacterium sp. Clip185 TaxID=3025663 RepID=UPI002365CEFA|nr:hypothetical protein [Microbacterium sp. Clip185]WDG17491.1 hypothetical protein PQV94_12795 [Microbacterium sp. Clip185]
MFEADHARKLLENMRAMNEELMKLAEQEAELMRQVNPAGKPAPATQEGVVLLSARMQIMTLTKAVHVLGETVVEILHDRLEEQRLGLG